MHGAASKVVAVVGGGDEMIAANKFDANKNANGMMTEAGCL